MGQVVWSKLAIKDAENIYDFIAKESPFFAQQTIEYFFARVLILADFPESGRQVPEYLRKDVREVIVGNYRIFYRVKVNYISIIRVHHSSRKIKIQQRSLKP